MAGHFITFEGGDGAGKSTQLTLLVDWLTEHGHPVVESREPGGTELGVELRNIVLHRRGYMTPRAEALLYAADRAHNIATVVRPAIEAGKIVVQDRYVDSSLAYQGAGRVLLPDEIRSLNTWATEGLVPDLTVLLDLDPTVGKSRKTVDLYDRLEAETVGFHAAVRGAYLALADAEPNRFLVLDATRPIEYLAASIRSRVSTLLT